MKSSITVKHSLRVFQPAEVVWDFTQNFDKRTLWDRNIKEVLVIQDVPYRLVKIRTRWGLQTVLKYKLENRPSKSSLAMKNTRSSIIRGGGGSWTYQKSEDFTIWTQTNTLILKKGLASLFLKSLVKAMLLRDTKRAMNKAKYLIENLEN